MRYGTRHGRAQVPSLGRYVVGSVLLHLCVAVGLALWLAEGDRGFLMPPSPPIRITLLHSDAGVEKETDVRQEKPNLLPSGDSRPSGDVAFPVERTEPPARDSPAAPQVSESPSPLIPSPATTSHGPPRGPSTSRRSTPPPARRVPPPPQPSILVRRQPLVADRESPASPSAPLPEVAQRRERPSVLAPSLPAGTHERRVGSLPLLNDADLAKYAQVPAGQPRSRPPRGVDAAISLTTTEVKYLAYFAHLKEKIERQWHYPAEAVTRGLGGQLVLLFVVQRSGQVSRVELLRSAGAKVLDQAAWEAVLRASPFDPVPPHISEEPLHIRARFTYLMEESAQRTRVQ